MNKILGFDGIRALAAISVVLTHTHVYIKLEEYGYLSKSFIHSIDGSAGVQAFFVLSGFLITSLLLNEYRKNGEISLFNFYVRRSLRIFPLYFLVVFLVAVAYFIGNNVTNKQSIIFSLFYSYNFITKDWYSSILGHTWSLAVEEHFYIIWPFIFISLAHKFRNIVFILLAFIVVSFFLRGVLYDIDTLKQNFFINRWSFIAGAYIAMGALFAMFIGDKRYADKLEKIVNNKISFVFVLLLIFNEFFISNMSYAFYQYLRGFGFSLLVVWLYFNQESMIVRFLEVKPLSYLGKISYGVYMYQGFFLATGPWRAENQSWPPDQAIGLLLLIFVAPLSFHYFENPITKLKYKFQKNKIP